MTGPVYGIRLTVDATGSREGRDVHVRSIEDIKRANASLTGTFTAQSQAVQALTTAHRGVATTSAAVAQVTSTATGTYEQARAALEKMGVSANQMSAALKAMGFEQQAVTVATAKAAQAQVLASSAAVTAVGGHNKLTSAAQALAFSMTGLPGPIGRVASALGGFAVGGGVTLAVTAGIGLIVAGYESLTREAREAKTATDDLVKSLADAFDERTGVAQRTQELAVTGRLAQAQQGRAELVPGQGWVRVVDEQEVERATKAVLEFYERIRDKNRERVAEEARLAEEAAARSKRLHDQELQQLTELAETRVRIFREFLQGNFQPTLFGTPNDQLFERLQGQAAYRQRLAAPLSAGSGSLPATSPAYQKLLEEYEATQQARLREIDSLQQSRTVLLGTIEAMKLLPESFTAAARAVSDLDAELERFAALGKDLDNLNLAETFTLIGLGIQAIATGGNVLKSIFGDPGGDARKAFQQRIADYETYKTAEKGFLAQGTQKSPLELLDEQYLNLLVTAQRLQQPTDELTASYQSQRQAILDQIEAANAAAAAEKALEEARRRQQEQVDRFAREGRWASIDEARADLRGDSAGVAAAQYRSRVAGVRGQFAAGSISQEELDAWLEIFAAQFQQALQDTADAAAAAAQAVRDFNLATNASLSVQALQYQAIIDGTEASRQRYEDAERELRQDQRIQDLIKNGADAATIANQQYVDSLEDVSVATDRARQAAAALRREQESARQFNDDLDVRWLRATGQGGLADDRAFTNRQTDEYNRAVDEGRSPTDLFRLQQTQAAERIAFDDARRLSQQQAFDAAVGANFSVTSPSFGPDSATSVNLAVGTSESTSNRLAGLMGSQLALQQASLALHQDMAGSLRRIEALLRRQAGMGPDALDEILGSAAEDADLVAGLPPSNR